jgi:hypothetical protein
MDHILDAVLAGETRPEQVSALPLPDHYRAVVVLA